MLLRRACVAVGAMVLLVAVPPAAAGALEGPVLLAFGATYTAPDGGSSTHRGIDVAAEAGAACETPVSGRVRFAGRVPGPGGESVWCVSIESDRGVVSLLPLEGVSVSKGDGVDVGDPIASVALGGDPSTAEPHLHIGLKSGDVYMDPTSLLAPAAPAPEVEESPPVPHAEGVSSVAPTPSSSAVLVAEAVATSTESVPQQQPAAPGDPAMYSQVASAVTRPTEVAVVGQPGVSVPTPAVDAPTPAVRVQVDRAAGFSLPLSTRVPEVAAADTPRVLSSTHAALGSVAGWKPASAPALAILGAAIAASAIIVTRRALVRRTTSVGPVSDRLGNLLQHLKAGDTLCGLTSCSGPLPSQSRGH